MIFGVEKRKLEKLHEQVSVLSFSGEESQGLLITIFKDYVQVIKKLHSREPNIFGNIHKYGIKEMKKHKEMIRKESNQQNFDSFVSYMQISMEDCLDYMRDYLHL